MGLSVRQISQLQKTGELSETTPDADAIVAAQKTSTNELQRAIANPMELVARGIERIVMMMAGSAIFGGSKTEQNKAEVSQLSDKELKERMRNQIGTFMDFTETVLKPVLNPLTGFKPQTEVLFEEIAKRNATSNTQKLQTKVESRAVGGTIGVDKAPTSPVSLMSVFKKLGSNEVPTILHKGEAVLNKSQMGMLSQLTGAQSGIAKSMTGFVENFTEQFAGSNGIIGKVTNMFGDKQSGGILGSITKSLSGSGSGSLMGKITGALGGSGGKDGGITSKITGLLGGTGSGGIMSKITGLFGGGKADAKAGNKNSGTGNLLSSVTKSLTGGEGIMGKLTGLFGSKKPDAKAPITKNLLGNVTKSLTGENTGIMGKLTGLFGGGAKTGGLFGKVSSLAGGNAKGGVTSGLLGKASGLLGGKASGLAGGLLSKIPGLGGAAGSLLKGGGIKNIGGNLLKAGAGKAIGGAIGTLIPIPGVGTLLGSALGGLASKGIGKLANSKIGKSVTGFLGKSPMAQIGKKYLSVGGKALGGIGKKLGGLFGKKKSAVPAQVQPDVSRMAGMSGLMSMGGSLGAAGFQSGINFGGQSALFTGQQQTNTQPSVLGDTKALEAKFDTMISLLKSGAIGVNIDGKKVSDSLVDANRYG